jgi:unsaturated chondroitin disaccharide hydrolase
MMKTMRFTMMLFAGLIISCVSENDNELKFAQLKSELSEQLKVLVQVIPEDKVPHSFPGHNAEYGMADYRGWTSGFPAGSFWLMYEMTGNDFWKDVAIENTEKLEKAQYLTNTHDLGFMIFCSYGNGYRLTGNEDYKKVIIQASESLLTRFHPVAGCIRSWDFGSWQFPVIVDNMMNLEMLFWASKVTGDPKYREVAVSHADVTLENHFRDDMSSYHVVSYDTLTGNAIEKQTYQGLNDESAWGRGQAWGFYGYTMCYRETGDEKYLNAAEKIGDFILSNMPEDMVLFWDFNDPAIPNAERDASATAIAASALFELSTFSDKGETYLNAANRIMESLSSQEYRATGGANGGFLMKHCVGHKPANREIDVALNYADYYYLEALKRQHDLKK